MTYGLCPLAGGRAGIGKDRMKIKEIKLYAIRAGNTGERGAQFGESQYWGGGWQTNSLIANPMSVYPQYARIRTQWMGPGQDPYAIEILTDEGVTGVATNYGGGPFACGVIEKHFSRFLDKLPFHRTSGKIESSVISAVNLRNRSCRSQTLSSIGHGSLVTARVKGAVFSAPRGAPFHPHALPKL
jgi:hypothetical protein